MIESRSAYICAPAENNKKEREICSALLSPEKPAYFAAALAFFFFLNVELQGRLRP